MPATRPNRLNNPLRVLRLLLGDGKIPITQEEFAARSGVALATLRAIETGRRPLENALDQIAVILHAAWWPQLKRWYVVNSTLPYEKKYAQLEPFDPQDPFLDDSALHRLLERVLDLFSAASREQRLGLLLYLNKHLKETAANFRIEQDLSSTEPKWRELLKPNVYGKPLPKNLVILPQYNADMSPKRRITPHNDTVFDFRSRRTFTPADYPAHSEEPEQMVQARTDGTGNGTAKQADFSRTYSGPKRDKPKKPGKKKSEYRLEIES